MLEERRPGQYICSSLSPGGAGPMPPRPGPTSEDSHDATVTDTQRPSPSHLPLAYRMCPALPNTDLSPLQVGLVHGKRLPPK